MKKNLGSPERIVRVLVAIAVAVLYLTNQSTGVAAVILGVIAVAFVLTSSAGFCPLYASIKFLAHKPDGK
jgi:Na+(H+)/acetate symporter ActP